MPFFWRALHFLLSTHPTYRPPSGMGQRDITEGLVSSLPRTGSRLHEIKVPLAFVFGLRWQKSKKIAMYSYQIADYKFPECE